MKKNYDKQHVDDDSKSDEQPEEKNEEEKKQNESEFMLSESEEGLIEDARVRCCYDCWLDYYRVICTECDYTYCIHCRQKLHNDYDCEEIKKAKKEIYLRKKLNEAQTEELMLREGWRRCPGCKVWVAKITGCNHMTHDNCPKPNELKTKNVIFVIVVVNYYMIHIINMTQMGNYIL
eukprot:UN04260